MFTSVVLAAGFILGWLAQFGFPGLGGFSVLWPQGWAFFTDLDKSFVVAYRFVEPGHTLSPLERVGFGGLGRAAESRLAETWHIARGVPDAYWVPCSRMEPLECGADLDGGIVYRTTNPFAGSQLCGNLAFSLERTDVPPFGTLPESPATVRRVALVDLDCG